MLEAFPGWKIVDGPGHEASVNNGGTSEGAQAGGSRPCLVFHFPRAATLSCLGMAIRARLGIL
jgi:hypothetical protein